MEQILIGLLAAGAVTLFTLLTDSEGKKWLLPALFYGGVLASVVAGVLYL